MKEYKPDGKCGTCRHQHHTRLGDGFHEPLEYEAECGVWDKLVKIRGICQEVADDIGDEEAYGEDPIEGWGETKPCPLYLEWETCKEHGLRVPPEADFGCPKCAEEAYEAEAAAMAEDERLAKEAREAGLL